MNLDYFINCESKFDLDISASSRHDASMKMVFLLPG
jgi:hypothetical protein